MTLREALPLALKADRSTNAKEVLVVSGLECYYFETFFKAVSMVSGEPCKTVQTEFGNLQLDLLRLREDLTCQRVVIVLEWEDFLPGASLRSDAKLAIDWDRFQQDPPLIEILASVVDQHEGTSFYLIPPLMKTAPVTGVVRGYADALDAFKSRTLARLHDMQQDHTNLSVLTASGVLSDYPESDWTDVTMWFKMGWPYCMEATHSLASAAHAVLGRRSAKKKLLITDLDNTFWRGIIGEDGKDGVSWDHSEATYKHRIYQRLLQRFSDEGVLIAVCSKNNESIAREGLNRSDLIFDKESIVASEINWSLKSESIRRILGELNLGADDAVFIDDSEFEINEVSTNVPGITSVCFPTENRDVSDFLSQIAALFESATVTSDDRGRVEQYKARGKINNELKESGNSDSFLRGLQMTIDAQQVSNPSVERPMQLINKTNQFNLNGLREDHSSWRALFEDGFEVFQFTLSDRIANHGVVAVAVCRQEQQNYELHHLVISCRVFSRKVEHTVVEWLKERSFRRECGTFLFRYARTDKNHSARSFLSEMVDGFEEYEGDETINMLVLKDEAPLSNYAEIEEFQKNK